MSCGPTIVTQKVLRPLKITRAPRGTVVVREPTQSLHVTREARETVVMREPVTNLVVPRPVTRVVKLVAEGPQGPPGPSSDGFTVIRFAYGDAPSVVASAPTDGVVTIVRIDIETPFNGAGAAITVGVLGDTDALMDAAANDPGMEASFEDVADYPVTAGAAIWLDITAGTGATQGAGALYLGFVPENL